MPLALGAPEQFRELRAALQSAGYTENGICQRLGIKTIFEFKTLRHGRETSSEIRDSLDALIRLLMDEEVIDAQRLAVLPPGLLDQLESLGVVARMQGNEAQRFSTGVLYPVASFYACSDRVFLPEGTGMKLPIDAVYAAITKNTGRFLSILPTEPCDAFLDLCAGTGIAGMVASGYARQAWSADLGARCVHFAEFNRRINGIENLHIVQGDLYEAVGDLTFDRIAAHPPYIPSQEREFLFRDGGEDGEQILARIVEGLPRYLRPGGRFYCVTAATDREGEMFEQRIRRWLGPDQGEFDVILVANESTRRPDGTIRQVVQSKKLELSPTMKLFEELKVRGGFYGTVVVERRNSSRAVVTARSLKAETAAGDAVEWFRRWHVATADPEFARFLMSARPRHAKSMALQVIHTPQDGQLMPSSFELRATYPFLAQAGIEPWVAVLMGACDGNRTGHQLFEFLREQEAITSTMSEQEFAGVLQVLISNSFLDLEQVPLPLKRD
jgi:methylase of polypeptide subunit release factors